jgi:hypothetical protein
MTSGRPDKRMRIALLLATTVVCLLGIAAELTHHLFHVDSPLVPLLSLSEEANLPTWYSSMLLLACAVALAAVASDVRQRGERWFGHWAALAAVFAYMSLDETAQLHERLNGFFTLRGVFYFGWIIPAGIIVAAIGLAYLRFVLQLPPSTRRRFVVAGVLYVGGALVMEVPLGLWSTRYGEANLGYCLIDAVEESMEMFGASLFFIAILQHRVAASRSERVEKAA